jgi:allantoin racemase
LKIKLINPDYGMSESDLRARETMLSEVCDSDVVLDMECLVYTKVVIDSLRDVALAAPEILRIASRAEKEGFDAVVLYCFSDPALAACREQLAIPVIGSGQAAILLAASLGCRLSVITLTAARATEKRMFIRACGLDEGRIASVRGVDKIFAPEEGYNDEILPYLKKTVLECVKEDGADVVVLGCLSLAGKGRELSDVVDAPIVDPAFVGVCAAQQAVRLKLSHSKLAYPFPPRLF